MCVVVVVVVVGGGGILWWLNSLMHLASHTLKNGLDSERYYQINPILYCFSVTSERKFLNLPL